MARPKKVGLGYFPLDCQMDDKIDMLKAVHGPEGFAAYIMLLQEIYQTSDGELDMAMVFRWKTLGKKFGIPEDKLRIIVTDMMEMGLFDKNYYQTTQKLTSNGIQKRLKDVEERRQKDRKRKSEIDSEFSSGKPSEKYTKGKGKGKGKGVDINASGDAPLATDPDGINDSVDGTGGQKKKKAKPENTTKEHYFKDSPYYNKQEFVAAMSQTDYAVYDLGYYHESVKNWADSGSTVKHKKSDWLATARNFMLRDAKTGDAKMKPKNQAQAQPAQQQFQTYQDLLKEEYRN